MVTQFVIIVYTYFNFNFKYQEKCCYFNDDDIYKEKRVENIKPQLV